MEVCEGNCDTISCEQCCEHWDVEDCYCLTCGKDLTEDMMAKAFDKYKDYMKYGE